MTTGYPRFFIHKLICALVDELITRYGTLGENSKGIGLPNPAAATRCVDFIRARKPDTPVEVVSLSAKSEKGGAIKPLVSVVICMKEAFPVAKQYWQHTGDGISSRRAKFCHKLLREGRLIVWQDSAPSSGTDTPRASTPRAVDPNKNAKGPRRYQRQQSQSSILDQSNPSELADGESSLFLEERFGRNLSIDYVNRAKSAIKRRIAGALLSEADILGSAEPLPNISANSRGISKLSEGDIHLFSCGMNAIFNAHRALLAARGSMKSVNFGFPYVDTLKILEKFGPGCHFYGFGSSTDLEELNHKLEGGEKVLALFCEFPGNPLLTCPDLVRIRSLADKYDFAVVVDETIGNFVNVNVLPYADMVVSSLTKIFSGDCNVTGGSLILNPTGRFYGALKQAMDSQWEEGNYWPEDIIFMERNSRDFVSRQKRINTNAEAICEVLLASPLVQKVYYPRHNESRPNYEMCKLPDGGYGGLLSVTFKHREQAIAFFDALETAKGPSLGTNFTLTSPYTLLAHYQELEWARGYGVDPDLVRISVGLEEPSHLTSIFRSALDAATHVDTFKVVKS